MIAISESSLGCTLQVEATARSSEVLGFGQVLGTLMLRCGNYQNRKKLKKADLLYEIIIAEPYIDEVHMSNQTA